MSAKEHRSPMIEYLYDKCNACLLCVEDCVAGCLREIDGKPLVAAEEMCNRCSHCVAVCPRGAIIHRGLDAEQVRRVNRKKLTAEVYAEIVRSRRSVRRYTEDPVDRALIGEILDLARYSPTSSNDQHLEYIVVTDRALLKKVSDSLFGMGKAVYKASLNGPGKAVYSAVKMAGPLKVISRYLDAMGYYVAVADATGRDYILHNAPVLIMVLAPKSAPFGCDNANIAAANITNHAHALGLGTCYIGFLTLALKYNPLLRKILGIPRGKKVFASLVMGHPKYRHGATTSRKPAPVTWREAK